MIAKIRTTPGRRAELASILLDGLRDMPGCLSYVVAEDPADGDILWVTEVWRDAESHRASLGLSWALYEYAVGLFGPRPTLLERDNNMYPEAWADHLYWTGTLLMILSRGPGIFSLDHLIASRQAARPVR